MYLRVGVGRKKKSPNGGVAFELGNFELTKFSVILFSYIESINIDFFLGPPK